MEILISYISRYTQMNCFRGELFIETYVSPRPTHMVWCYGKLKGNMRSDPCVEKNVRGRI